MYAVEQDSKFSLSMSADKKIVSVGETFVVTVFFSVANDVNLSENPPYNRPDFKGFMFKELLQGKIYQKNNYQIIEHKYILTAQSEGSFTIMPAKAKIGLIDKEKADMFGEEYGVNWTEITSNVITIKVNSNSKKIEFYSACRDGDAKACNNLGVYYEKGETVKQDYSKAIKFYTKACNGREYQGCSNLGYMYDEGKGINQNKKKAIELHKKSCKNNNAQGCYNLGVKYENGLMVKQNYSEAVKLYTKACNGGYLMGCNNLGLMYAGAKGVNRNYNKAVKLYTNACDKKNMTACYNLGYMYVKGWGVKKDYYKAKKMYSRACRDGIQQACDNKAIIDKILAKRVIDQIRIKKKKESTKFVDDPSTNFITIKLPRNITIELPKNWIILDEDRRITLDSAVESMLDLSGRVQNKDWLLPFAANYYENNRTNALVNLRYYPSYILTQSDLKQLSQRDIESIDKALKNTLTSSSKDFGYSIVSWKKTVRKKIGDMSVLVTEYKRTPLNKDSGLFRVRLIRIIDGSDSFTLTVSYDTDNEILMKPITGKIIQSLTIKSNKGLK
jgi:TPR repeat protein